MNGIYAGIGVKSIGELFVLIIVFSLVLFITYYVTRWIGNIQKTQLSSGNINIVEVRRFMGNKQLALVKVGEEFFLIGVGKDEMTFIGKVDGSNIHIEETPQQSESFSAILDKIKNIREKKK